ncbi:hypothetical protein MTP99_010949 [Tenebrio molitor]|jgi:hypothetical protein|uniref:uncharacterized protein n=1 Tax=Tenebrio molitor TaxID=7067 RepID=UPI0026FB15CB|nr:hypothetical protein MTP99_010949 [Tenebrio molitor]
MLTIVIVGVVTLLSQSVTTQLFDAENEDYANSPEDYEFNSNIDGGFGWLELEQKALYLSNQATYDENEDYEKYESVRGIPMRIDHQKSKYCMEKLTNITKVPTSGEHVFPSIYHNIACVPSNLNTNPHSVRCKSAKNNKCVTLTKEMHVFRKKRSDSCWKPAETITVEMGCRCF